MIVIINGAFGVGKTTLAHLLRDRLPKSSVYNPENTGSFLRSTVGRFIKKEDYQDLPGWCPFVVGTAAVISRLRPGRLLIPMTLWNREYFDSITGGLRRVSPDVICLRLTASEAELRRRILGRADEAGGHGWCLGHVEQGVAIFSDRHFGDEIVTDGKSPEEVAIEVMNYLTSPTNA